MENFFKVISNSIHFNKIEMNEITFVQYDCPIQESVLPIWAPHDYVIHILNGQKTWITSHGTTTLKKGDTAFIKKGGYIVRQNFSENFCLLIFFIKDNFKSQLSFEEFCKQLSYKRDNTELVLYH